MKVPPRTPRTSQLTDGVNDINIESPSRIGMRIKSEDTYCYYSVLYGANSRSDEAKAEIDDPFYNFERNAKKAQVSQASIVRDIYNQSHYGYGIFTPSGSGAESASCSDEGIDGGNHIIPFNAHNNGMPYSQGMTRLESEGGGTDMNRSFGLVSSLDSSSISNNANPSEDTKGVPPEKLNVLGYQHQSTAPKGKTTPIISVNKERPQHIPRQAFRFAGETIKKQRMAQKEADIEDGERSSIEDSAESVFQDDTDEWV